MPLRKEGILYHRTIILYCTQTPTVPNVKAVLELSTVLTVVASSVETSCLLVSDSLGGGMVHIHDCRDLLYEVDNTMTDQGLDCCIAYRVDGSVIGLYRTLC